MNLLYVFAEWISRLNLHAIKNFILEKNGRFIFHNNAVLSCCHVIMHIYLRERRVKHQTLFWTRWTFFSLTQISRNCLAKEVFTDSMELSFETKMKLKRVKISLVKQENSLFPWTYSYPSSVSTKLNISWVHVHGHQSTVIESLQKWFINYSNLLF